jgi:hypothetical protein
MFGKKWEKGLPPSIAPPLLLITHLFSRFFMADPFVLKVLRVLTAVFTSVYHSLLLGTYSSSGLNSLYGLPHLLWKFPEFKQLIVASQCLLPFPIIGNLKFHWTKFSSLWVTHSFPRFFMAYPFVPKVLHGWPVCSQSSQSPINSL